MEYHQKCLILAAFLSSCILLSAAQDNATLNAEIALTRKALSVFNVIKFPNAPCSPSSGAKNGTCYTASECSNKKGVATGTCANSFGVCCIFTIGCGGTSSENATFFDSGAAPNAGACVATICKCNPNVCSLRLDFANFVISGPNTLVAAVTTIVAGQPSSLAVPPAVKAILRTECLTDTFSVTGTGSGNPPVICGTNTNQHMYVDASASCNKMVFQLGNIGIGTALATRAWSVKVTQIPCDSLLLPPSGCTQYFFGPNTGIVTTFNFVSGSTTNVHLANQDQVICIRRERGTCRVCYTTVAAATDFNVSGGTGTKNGGTKSSKGFTKAANCCGYVTTKTASAKGYDCVSIPGASKSVLNAAMSAQQLANFFCGHRFTTKSNLAVAISGTVCSRQSPFQISFISDNFEYLSEVKGNSGFKLLYTLSNGGGC